MSHAGDPIVPGDTWERKVDKKSFVVLSCEGPLPGVVKLKPRRGRRVEVTIHGFYDGFDRTAAAPPVPDPKPKRGRAR